MSLRDTLHTMFSGYSVEERCKAFEGDENYSKFYSTLDAWFDTEDALLEIERRKGPLPMLSNMGLFVALRTQQDAIFVAGNILRAEISLTADKRGGRIRNLCNRVLHPIMNQKAISTFFPVSSTSIDGFQIAFYGDEKSTGEFIEYDEILRDHRAVIESIEEKIQKCAEEIEFQMFQKHPRQTLIGGKVIKRGDDRFRTFEKRCAALMPPPLKLNVNFNY